MNPRRTAICSLAAATLAGLAVAACKSHDERPHGEAPLIHPRAIDAIDANAAAPAPDATAGAPAPPDAATRWPELASFPPIDAVRVVALPSRPDVPRFDVGGPAIVGDTAVVSSSQFGFAGVDYHRGAIAWTKPAGAHVAPPLARKADVVLIGDCVHPQPVPATDTLLGCLRIATANTGADEAYFAIHGATPALAEFADAAGPQQLWLVDDHAVRWRRGDRAVAVDLVTGIATAITAGAPPIVVAYKGHTWDITRVADGAPHAGEIIAREGTREAWRTQRAYTAMLGTVWLPEQAPMLRLMNQGAYGHHPELNLFDIDATGSLHGQVAFPVPGIGILAWSVSSVGDAAVAVRLDASLRRDFIVGYAASSLLMWVYPLPEQARADAIGVAIASDAVVVFHDGDTLTILPELSAPPTAPGAVRAPSQNPTP